MTFGGRIERLGRLASPAVLCALVLTLAACTSTSLNQPGKQIEAPAKATVSTSAPVHEEAWTQYVSGGVEIRAISDGASCPPAVLDGKAVPMNLRTGPQPGFPGIVCSIRVPAGTRAAMIDGHHVPLPATHIRRIVIFGDTGCRLKGAAVQDCNDPNKWPFAKVAALAASLHPDLIVHVGDYYYRETPCPAGDKGCNGSPHGDAWPSWKADFFDPARPLLATSPWVFARGNHERCGRGAKGWFRFLDAASKPKTCPSDSAPFAVPLGGVTLDILDSANADDTAAPPTLVSEFSKQLDILNSQHSGKIWIVTHRPIWGFAPVKFGPVRVLAQLDKTERAAAREHGLKNVALIVSGHVHNFEDVDFHGRRPAQLVVGSGGDTEEHQPERAQSFTSTIGGLKASILTFRRFGFLVLNRTGDTWKGAFHDLNNRIIARCQLTGRALACRAIKSKA